MIPTSAVSSTTCNPTWISVGVNYQAPIKGDANGNGILDACECTADIAPPEGDGNVGIEDLLEVIGNWGACPAPPNPCTADVAPFREPDGVVNIFDLLWIANKWGMCP
jgi:hypothetical protein